MRLIDADALLKCVPYEDVNSRFAVQNAPTIEERKKGRWLDSEGKEKYVGYCGECSACGGWSEYITDFCPNCGADMRGGQNG